MDAPRTEVPPETGILGVAWVGDGPRVGVGPGVEVGPAVGVGPMVMVVLHTSGTSEKTKLLSRTRQEKLKVPFWVTV